MVYKIQLVEKKKGKIIKNEEYDIDKLMEDAIFQNVWVVDRLEFPPIWMQIFQPKRALSMFRTMLQQKLSNTIEDIYEEAVNYLKEKIKEDNFGKKKKR